MKDDEHNSWFFELLRESLYEGLKASISKIIAVALLVFLLSNISIVQRLFDKYKILTEQKRGEEKLKVIEPQKIEAPDTREEIQKQPEAQQKGQTKYEKLYRTISDEEFVKLCILGDATGVEDAIANGSNVNARNNDGGTPLTRATLNGNTEVVRLLLKYGANVNAKDNSQWIALDGNTALDIAAWKGYTNIIDILLKYGANVNARQKDGGTALMSTAIIGHTDVAELLLKHGANVNARDKDGWTALRLAANYRYTGIIKLLRSYGAQ